ncbi:glycoside hydrolase family 78 protein [Pseudobutyrivibrio sp.]|uniref:glycoside hydrolase family 78 protein n=1 Tax=Pseudobutyrivibrio sp. TaxID=2014367 RepID=UPI001DF6535A|nr:glycoside hydrolase family 78 protein [Pseudobutyrivibrio sp.]MBE5910135.1 alpha-L-rhamnosidase [Pseudobutyrivibrio sp.]
MLGIKSITVNYQCEPSGIVGPIQVGWKLKSDERNVKQLAYHLLIKDGDKTVYDSGKVESEESAHVYINEKWDDIRKYDIEVKAFTEKTETDWAKSYFVSGYQDISAWTGAFVTAEPLADADESYGTLVRDEFTVEKEIDRAYLVSTAHGLYRPFINGKKVGEDELTPGWTSYNKRLQYQTIDVSNVIKQGRNAWGAMLGAGWFKGDMSFNHKRNLYGKQTAFGGQIIIDYKDGNREVISTTDKFKGHKSPVIFSEIYDGEIYDARLEETGWCEAGYDDSSWIKTEVVARDIKTLVPQEGHGVRVITKLLPKEIITTPEGDTVIDFGQNLTGWVEFSVENASEGDEVELNCFEVLDSKGNVYLDNLRGAKETVKYTCKGSKKETFHPNFTFMGFQYVKINKFPGEIKKENFKAYAVHSDMTETGFFECSNKLINQLQHNIKWGMKGNFVDVPTDCPQRDERLGWTGDAQIFCSTATFLMDTYSFYSKWMKDVEADQAEDGAVAHVVPDILTGYSEGDWLMKNGTAGSSAWGDVAVIEPWTMYLYYGDTSIIERQFDSMKAWIDFMTAHSKEDVLFNYGLQFGDWVALDAEEGSYFGATPVEYTCSAYYTYVTGLFSQMAKAIGRDKEASEYGALYNRLRKSFNDHFVNDKNEITVETQTAQIVALYFNLVDGEVRKNAVTKLKELLDKENGHLVTGFIGTPYINHALSENGCLKEAYDLLLKDDFPSWLYQVKMGATTVWEHWDGLKPDGTMWSPDMNSFNHYAYGSIGDWIYKVIGGIKPDESNPGFKHFCIAPEIGGALEFANTNYESVYGTIGVNWKKSSDKVQLHITVPVNTTATVILKHAKEVENSDGLSFTVNAAGYIAEAGSGEYNITYIE